MSSLEFETNKGGNIESPKGVSRHSHNGIDSDKIDISNIGKRLLPQDIGDEYVYDGLPFFDGHAEGYPGSAPQLTLTTNSVGDTIVDPSSITLVNAWLDATNDMLIQLKKRQETYARVFVRNGFASYQQNPSSDAYDPLYTYFDRL